VSLSARSLLNVKYFRKGVSNASAGDKASLFCVKKEKGFQPDWIVFLLQSYIQCSTMQLVGTCIHAEVSPLFGMRMVMESLK